MVSGLPKHNNKNLIIVVFLPKKYYKFFVIFYWTFTWLYSIICVIQTLLKNSKHFWRLLVALLSNQHKKRLKEKERLKGVGIWSRCDSIRVCLWEGLSNRESGCRGVIGMEENVQERFSLHGCRIYFVYFRFPL